MPNNHRVSRGQTLFAGFLLFMLIVGAYIVGFVGWGSPKQFVPQGVSINGFGPGSCSAVAQPCFVLNDFADHELFLNNMTIVDFNTGPFRVSNSSITVLQAGLYTISGSMTYQSQGGPPNDYRDCIGFVLNHNLIGGNPTSQRGVLGIYCYVALATNLSSQDVFFSISAVLRANDIVDMFAECPDVGFCAGFAEQLQVVTG